jgi:hypothetical protein
VSPTERPTPDSSDNPPPSAESDVFTLEGFDESDSPDPAEPPRGLSVGRVISRRNTAALAVSGLLVVLLCGAGSVFLARTVDQPGTAADDATGAEATELVASASPGDQRTSGNGTEIGDGQWIVGDDIDYGTFAATVPADSPGCSWERADSDDGSSASIIDSGIAHPGEAIVVTIKPSDRVFRSSGCGTWRAIAS